MGGIGKTTLAVKAAQQIQGDFDYIIWRSLRNAPPIQELLTNLILFLSNQQVTAKDLPESIDDKILRLLDYLRSSRCLLIVDNVETILRSGNRTGHYQAGFESYKQLLECISEAQHQSCLLLTSREKPKGIAINEGLNMPVRSLYLNGLTELQAEAIFTSKGFSGTQPGVKTLIEHYRGNP
jgi:hypothetical protein